MTTAPESTTAPPSGSPPGADAPSRERRREAEEQVRRELFFVHYAPFICVSAKEGKSLGLIFDTIRRIRKGAEEPLGTGKLNLKALKELAEAVAG